MITRRDALAGALTTTLATASATAGAAAAPTPSGLDDLVARRAALLRGGPPINLERAYRVMQEDGLDGFVLCLPTNVFHVSGYTDHLAQMHEAPASFVLLSRNPLQAPGLVMSQFLHFYKFPDEAIDYPLQKFLYTGWGMREGDPSSEVASPPFVFVDSKQAPLRDFERRRYALQDTSPATQPAALSPSAERALARAAREMGLDRGRIGFDSAVVLAAFAAQGLEPDLTYADNSLRRIRMIKSPREIELMRIAARANAEASIAAVRAVRPGMSHAELRAIWAAELARRGNVPEIMQVDTIMADATNPRFARGTAFAIDCLSHGHHYRGDYGRTVFVGEPTRAIRRATAAISLAWDELRAQLRPGLRYSDIKRIGQETLRKAGYDFDVAFSAHSCGLSHTDDAGRAGQADFWVKGDTVLEENMVISIDLPVRQSGLGGSAHLEDLTLITKDGGEQINDIGDRTIQV